MLSIGDLKALTRRLVKSAGGPANAAKICGVSDSSISNWVNEETPQYAIPFLQLLKLDAIDPLHPVLNEMARVYGCQIVYERRQQSGGCSVISAMGESARAHGELHQETAVALMDGTVTENEMRRVTSKGFEAIDRIRSMMQQLSGARA